MNSRKNKILIIMDEAAMLQSIIAILENEGYDATGINSDGRIFEITQQFRPNIILLSVTLNNTNGHFLCMAIKGKNKRKDLAIILLKSKTDDPKIAYDECILDDSIMMPSSDSNILTTIQSNLAKLSMV